MSSASSSGPAMSQPEMSYAPAYFQDSGHFARPSVPTPYRQSLPRHPHDQPDRSSVQHSPDHARSPASPSQYSPPPAEQPSAVPPSLAAHPRLEDGSIFTGSSSSSRGASKEDRTRGSWGGRSSFMSSDNRHPQAVPRVQKQAFHSDSSADGEDALLMLFRLSIPVPIFSIGAAAYTVLALFFVLLTSPLRLCSVISKSTTLRTRLCEHLAPALHVHERLVRSPRPLRDDRTSSTQWIYNDDVVSPSREPDPSECYSASGLIGVLLLSAFLCVPLLLVTWIVACFWVFAKIMGNPDGTERKDDGRTAVLGVTHWWQRWLAYARR